MEKKDSKLQNFLKSIGLLSGSGGIAGIIIALSGICLPCILIPLGFIGAGLLFIFSFISEYRWWFIGASVILFLLALSLKRVTICKDGVCQIDKEQNKKLVLSFSTLKANLKKVNNWKTYVAIPIILLLGSLIFVIYLSTGKTGEMTPVEPQAAATDPYARLLELAPTKGPADAKITIIEFSDYFCPHCLPLYEDVIEPVLEKYEGKIRFTAVQVNILMNMGYSSAHAAYCAEEQGEFWQMHDLLMQQIRPFVDKPRSADGRNEMEKMSKQRTPEYFTLMADMINGVDTKQFLGCMNSDKYSSRIQETTDIFLQMGFNGVPTVLVNDKYFTGGPTLEELTGLINAELND